MGTEALLAAVADEVVACQRCRLAAGRHLAVPGEGNPRSDVLLVGEGPGAREDATGRPFVGPAGQLLDELLRSIGWAREDVFIANVVKCRPPGNRDPEPDEIAACTPYLQRQLEVLDPAVVVTLGRFSMAHFRPGERITQIHGTRASVAPGTGARDADSFALFHPAAALRSTDVERQSYADVAGLPGVLREARSRRGPAQPDAAAPAIAPVMPAPVAPAPAPSPVRPTEMPSPFADPADDAPTLFQG